MRSPPKRKECTVELANKAKKRAGGCPAEDKIKRKKTMLMHDCDVDDENGSRIRRRAVVSSQTRPRRRRHLARSWAHITPPSGSWASASGRTAPPSTWNDPPPLTGPRASLDLSLQWVSERAILHTPRLCYLSDVYLFYLSLYLSVCLTVLYFSLLRALFPFLLSLTLSPEWILSLFVIDHAV